MDGLDSSASELMSKLAVQARSDVQQLKGLASSVGKKASKLASSFLNDLQDRYS